MERVIEALSQLPRALWEGLSQEIYRMARSEDHPNPATSSGKTIALYDSAFDSHKNLARILSHELAHQLFASLSSSDRDAYLNSSHWFELKQFDGSSIYVRNRSGFVEEDGRKDPNEDFANNLEYYLFQRDQLKKVTPGVHEWIKNHFGDNFKIGKVGGPND